MMGHQRCWPLLEFVGQAIKANHGIDPKEGGWLDGWT